jgi:hypothetical protein
MSEARGGSFGLFSVLCLAPYAWLASGCWSSALSSTNDGSAGGSSGSGGSTGSGGSGDAATGDATSGDATSITDAFDASPATDLGSGCAEHFPVSCISPFCAPAAPVPEVVVRHLITTMPQQLTASADYVAWYDAASNLILSVSTAGCGERFAEVVLAPSAPPPSPYPGLPPVTGLALDGHTLYWIGTFGFPVDGGSVARSAISRCPIDDCRAENRVVMNAQLNAPKLLAVDEASLYFYSGIQSILSRCSKSDCAQVADLPEHQNIPSNPMTGLVVDDQFIYVSGVDGYSLYSYTCQCAKPDCAVCDRHDDRTVIVAADALYLYAGGARAPKPPGGSIPDGGAFMPVDAGVGVFSTGASVAVAGGFAYWFAPDDGGTLALVRTPTR